MLPLETKKRLKKKNTQQSQKLDYDIHNWIQAQK